MSSHFFNPAATTVNGVFRDPRVRFPIKYANIREDDTVLLVNKFGGGRIFRKVLMHKVTMPKMVVTVRVEPVSISISLLFEEDEMSG